MGEIHMMNGAQQHGAIGKSRRQSAKAITVQREDARLVEGRKTLYPVAVAAPNQRGIVGKPLRAIAVGPAAEIVEGLRQVPVIEAKPGFDAGG